MGRKLAAIFATMGFVLSTSGCNGQLRQVGAAPASVVGSAELRSELQALVDKDRIPGAIAIIERDGSTLAQAQVGWLDVGKREPLAHDALFRLYSMSKPITSAAILMLVDEGKLRLDDPVSQYLPELADLRVYYSGGLEDMQTVPANGPITISQLLTHTSGITYHFTGDTPVHQFYRKYGVMRDTPVGRTPEDGPPARSLDELVAKLGKAPLLYQPGEEFAYSYSTTVLGAVIERVSSEPLDQALDRMLFAPLGMADTGFFVEDEDLDRFTTLYSATPFGIEPVEQPETSDYRDHARLLDGGGAIVGTAADYLRFARMLANGGELGGRRYMKADTVADMFTPHARMEGLGGAHQPFGYGVSIGTADSAAQGLQPLGTVSWSGSGNTYFFIDPRTRLVALLMTHELNGTQQTRTREIRSVLNRAAAQYLGD